MGSRLSRLREEMARNPDPPPNVMRQPAQVGATVMGDCQAQLQAALSQGDDAAVLQFSAKLTQGAERMLQMKCVGSARGRVGGAFRTR